MSDGSTPARKKPLLRGVSHEAAAYLSAPAAVALWASAPASLQPGVAAYGLSLVVLFMMSAVYHRPTWRPRMRDWLGRCDHSAIFLLIAGTGTPLFLSLGPGAGHTVLWVVWSGALAGVAMSLLWPTVPKALMAGLCVLLGWAAVPVLPDMFRVLGPAVMALVVAGGLLYTVGAFVYARKWPDPFPAIFGYHEIFHLCVIAAAVLHFSAVAGALPSVASEAGTAAIGVVKARGGG
jgi:hemolysin III